MSDEDLLIQADSVVSLIRARESHGLSSLTVQDIDELLRVLRPRTNQIIHQQRAAGDPREDGTR